MAAATMAGLVPVAFLHPQRRTAALAALGVIVALAGGMRFAAWNDRPPPDLERYAGRTLSVEGHIDSESNPGNAIASYRFAAEHVQIGTDWVATNGKLMATFDQYAAYSPGDHLILTGDLEDPPIFPDFDYRGYLARSDTVATLFFPKVEPLGAPGWQPRPAGVTGPQRPGRLPPAIAARAGGLACRRDRLRPRWEHPG